MKQILNYIESQLENLDKGIIATPSSEKYLKAFAEKKNKAIAEYMGLYTKKDGYNLQAIGNKGVKYHNSWDWLMPVINRCYQEHMSKEIAEDVMSCDIEKAYNAVIKFITD